MTTATKPRKPRARKSNPDANGNGQHRDAYGRFQAGNPGGVGNPYARQVAMLRHELMDRTRPEDIREIGDKLIAMAKAGNVQAAKVLFSYTLGAPAPAQDPDRVNADEAKAQRLETIGVEAFVDEWLAQPMFTGLAFSAGDRRHRLRNTVDGLAASLRLAGTGAQVPVWEALANVRIPVLVLAGERDAKFTEIGRRMAAAIPNATFAPIPSAGHAAHSEQPEATAALIGAWLS